MDINSYRLYYILWVYTWTDAHCSHIILPLCFCSAIIKFYSSVFETIIELNIPTIIEYEIQIYSISYNLTIMQIQ